MENKKTYITLISVVSSVAVVFLHTNGCFWNFSRESYWISANVIECLFYFAVPCFFMITGCTLIDFNERYSLREFFSKRIRKTLYPYLFWSLVGLLFQIFILKNISLEELSMKYVINGLFASEFVSIYWFFPSLFSVYLSLPLFSYVNREYRFKIFSYLIICGLILNGIIPLIIELINLETKFSVSLIVASGHIIYILIGYVLSNLELSKKQNNLFYFSSVCAFFIHFVGTMILSYQAGYVVRTFKGYTNVLSVIYSSGVFLFLKNNSKRIMKSTLVRKMVDFLSIYTFAIYLLQFFIYKSFIKFFDINVNSIVYRLGFPPILIVIVVIITKFLRKIPLLKYTVPK